MIVQTDNSLDLGPSMKIPLTKGLYALVSPEDYEWVSKQKWCAKKSFSGYYAMRRLPNVFPNKFIFMHRAIASTKSNRVCHHRNRRTLDNRRGNLQNMSDYDHRKLYSWR